MVSHISEWLEQHFPNLRSSEYSITSSETSEYNCIAWAAGDTGRWWWPRHPYYWPEGIPSEETLGTFIQAFALLGFIPCEGFEPEQGFEKIAIYVDGNGKPTHAARQLTSGYWTSKLGRFVDIEHSLLGLTNSEYGQVAQILKRPMTSM